LFKQKIRKEEKKENRVAVRNMFLWGNDFKKGIKKSFFWVLVWA